MGRAFEYRKSTIFARNDRLSKEFSKASRQIAIAVKESGPDPETNHKLRRAIQNAKGVSMPKDRIEAAIKKASDTDTTGFQEPVYEGMGPHGVAMVVETATDNTVRTVADVRAAFRKKGGQLGTNGMHDFIFDRKGVFFITPDQVEDIEELELELIDFGLEEIKKDTVEEEELYLIFTTFADFGKMQEALEKLNLEVKKAELQRLPNHTKELTDEQVDEVLALIDKLEELDDVQTVFHNLA